MKKACLFIFLLCSSLSVNGYQHLLFYRNGFLPQEKEAIFDSAMKKLGEKSKAQKINIVQPEAKEFVEKYDLKCAPMPFVLVVANNGAITGSFACDWSEEELINAIVSPAMEETLKALQANKLVFILISNKKAEHPDITFKGVEDFVADPKYADATAIVHLDLSDPKEEKLLKQFQIDLSSKKSTVIFLSPPGDSVGKFEGSVTKEELVKSYECASSGCCPGGCCPGGCCPK